MPFLSAKILPFKFCSSTYPLKNITQQLVTCGWYPHKGQGGGMYRSMHVTGGRFDRTGPIACLSPCPRLVVDKVTQVLASEDLN